ncbi:MAG: hypothetical protein ABIP74_01845 [Candidatus Saccharimonas sp.]
MRTIIKGRLVALVVSVTALALALSGCTIGTQEQPLPVLTKLAAIGDLNCADSVSALTRLKVVEKSTATDDEKAKFKEETQVDPTDKTALKKLRTALEARISAACVEDKVMLVPAHNADIQKTEFIALANRCGTRLNTSSLIAPTKDDKASYVIKGKGQAFKSLKDYECILMTNPTATDMWGKALYDVKLPSGRTFGEVNKEWIAAARAKSKTSGLANAWTVAMADGTVYVTSAFQRDYAFNIVTFIRRMEKHSGTGTAVWHYPLEVKTNGLPNTYKSSKPYVGRFILLTYTPKGSKCAALTLAINKDDGRAAKVAGNCAPPPRIKVPPRHNPPPKKHTPPKKHKCTYGGTWPSGCHKNPHPKVVVEQPPPTEPILEDRG